MSEDEEQSRGDIAKVILLDAVHSRERTDVVHLLLPFDLR